MKKPGVRQMRRELIGVLTAKTGKAVLFKRALERAGFTKMLLMKDPNRQNLAGAMFFIKMMGAGRRTLNDELFRNCVDGALKANDEHFFIAIGKGLSDRKAGRLHGMSDFVQNLEVYLVHLWDGSLLTLTIEKEAVCIPPLNVLDGESRATVCRFILKNPNLSTDAVEKCRQRLGLKPSHGKKFHVTLVRGTLRVSDLDKSQT